MLYEYKFLLSLAVTVITETVVLYILLRAVWKEHYTGLPHWRIIFAGVFCSFATLPYVWFVLPVWVKSYHGLTVVGETSVILTEWLLYGMLLSIGRMRALAVSMACNAASYLVGLLVIH